MDAAFLSPWRLDEVCEAALQLVECSGSLSRGGGFTVGPFLSDRIRQEPLGLALPGSSSGTDNVSSCTIVQAEHKGPFHP